MDHRLKDSIQSMMALSQAIQNRLIQSACKGRMSDGVRAEIASHAESISDMVKRIGDQI